MSRSLLGWIYAVVCGLVGVVCLMAMLDRHVIDLGSIAVLTSLFLLLGSTALSVVRHWRIASWLAGISAALFFLYGVSVVLLGWEDVGGARGAIPLASVPVLVAVLGAFVAGGSGVKRGEAA
jgi:hypothetical protein